MTSHILLKERKVIVVRAISKSGFTDPIVEYFTTTLDSGNITEIILNTVPTVLFYFLCCSWKSSHTDKLVLWPPKVPGTHGGRGH